jgi:hypothetical protein
MELLPFSQPVKQAGEQGRGKQAGDNGPPHDPPAFPPQIAATHPRQQIKSLPLFWSPKGHKA